MSLRSTSPFRFSPDTSETSTLGAIWTSRYRRPLTRLEYARQQMDRKPQASSYPGLGAAVAMMVFALLLFYCSLNPELVVAAADTTVRVCGSIGGR